MKEIILIAFVIVLTIQIPKLIHCFFECPSIDDSKEKVGNEASNNENEIAEFDEEKR